MESTVTWSLASSFWKRLSNFEECRLVTKIRRSNAHSREFSFENSFSTSTHSSTASIIQYCDFCNGAFNMQLTKSFLQMAPSSSPSKLFRAFWSAAKPSLILECSSAIWKGYRKQHRADSCLGFLACAKEMVCTWDASEPEAA